MTDQGTHLMDVVQWMTNSGPPMSRNADDARSAFDKLFKKL